MKFDAPSWPVPNSSLFSSSLYRKEGKTVRLKSVVFTLQSKNKNDKYNTK